MQRKRTLFFSWAAVLLCAAIIFCFSAQSGSASADLSSSFMAPFSALLTRLFGEAAHTIVRKAAHFTAYAVLMFWTYHAFYRTRRTHRLRAYLPFLCCVLYAVSDEAHQYFVPGRACKPQDVAIDALGCAAGGLCFYFAVKLRHKKTDCKKVRSYK